MDFLKSLEGSPIRIDQLSVTIIMSHQTFGATAFGEQGRQIVKD